MTAKLRSLSPVVSSVLVGVVALLVLAAGVYFVVMPQRHTSAQLGEELASTKVQIVRARALAAQRPEQRIRVADLFKVVEAMPDDDDMTGVILQLQQTASEAGVSFDSIQPQAAEPGTGYETLPIDLIFNGNYFSLTDFLFRLRKLVAVHNGKLDSTGRLFTVQRLDFQPGEKGFPQIGANVRVSAYVYSPSSMASGLVPVPPNSGQGASTTTTPSSDAVASGAAN